LRIEDVHFTDGKNRIQLIGKKGEAMGTCATFNNRYLCCNVKVLRSVHNCPFDCSYCFLQNYLTDVTTKVVDDISALMEEVKEKISDHSGKLFRIGTWELGDSLALEKETGQAHKLILEFSRLSNAVLELKTKSDCVDSILSLDHRGKSVVSWSLNTSRVIKTEEHGTASLKERLEAMHKAVRAGYLIGMHFDPMIYYAQWERDYEDLIRQVFETVPPERVAWISIGSLRFNPEMKKKIENNFPENRLTCAEMVLGDDNKVRYIKPLRVQMFKLFFHALRQNGAKDILIYLCMERWDVWDKVLGYHPDSISHLDYLFAQSLYERYGLMQEPPQRKHYDKE
jgi:spore photoproduct lyase